jgi:4-amino-4-deoxy-L-arabinose transferase-like glycosyltransferase
VVGLKDFRENKVVEKLKGLYKDPFFLLIVITVIVTAYLLNVQINLGIAYYDVYTYLDNAMNFAGLPIGNLGSIYLSPLIPFLTSLVFRMGYVSSNVIFILDAVIFVFGVIGLYLLFMQRFNAVQSITAVLIFFSFPLIFIWAVSGGIDIPGISFSIWTIYFLVLGVKKDSKFLYMVFPLAALAFVARYTSFILIFPILLYLVINEDFLKNIKKLLIGASVGLLLIIPFFAYIYYKLGNFSAITGILSYTLGNMNMVVNDVGYNPDKLFFLKNLLNYISVGPLRGTYSQLQSPSQGDPSIFAYIISLIVIVGLAIYVYRILKVKIQKSDRVNRNRGIMVKALVILIIAGIISFFTYFYIVTEVIFFLVLFLGYRLLMDSKSKEDELKYMDMDFLFLAWGIAFFIFHSVISIKNDRYFITMVPALTYFMILGLSVFIEKFKFKFKNKKLRSWGIRSWGIYLLVGLILLTSTTAVQLGHTPKKTLGYHIEVATDWLKEYDPNYRDKIIYSDYSPATTWYLQKEVKEGVPRIFGDYQHFSDQLKASGAYYYIDTLNNPSAVNKTVSEIPGYHIIKSTDLITIYQIDP